MNWEIVSSTGEWAGAIAVVATLIYLAKQIKQQNDIARYNAYESLYQGFNQNNQLIAANPQVAELLMRGLEDPDSLSVSESTQWSALFRTYFNHMQRAYKAYKLGFLSQEDWTDIAKNFAADISTPGGVRFREGHEHVFPEFWQRISENYDENFSAVKYGWSRTDV
jgi:hypothetical protein